MTVTSRILKHCLCDASGRPVYIATSFRKCLHQYVSMREIISPWDEAMLSPGTAVAMLKHCIDAGWSIRTCTVRCTPARRQIKTVPEDDNPRPEGKGSKFLSPGYAITTNTGKRKRIIRRKRLTEIEGDEIRG